MTGALGWGWALLVLGVARALLGQRRARCRAFRRAGEHPVGGERLGRNPSRPRWRNRLTSRLPVGLFGARRASMQRRRQADDLPVAVEVVRMALGAGLTPAAALRTAEATVPEVLAPAFSAAVSALDAGAGLRDALEALAREAPGAEALVEVLGVSDELGAAVGSSLAALGAELRAERRRHREARARTVPVRLLFPLVFLVLPAFLLLAVVPSLLAGFGS